MATKHNKFARGSGVFSCKTCRKQTRDVNGENAQLGMCVLCQTKAESGNALSDAGFGGDAWAVFDNCQTVSEANALLESEIKKLG